MRNTLSQLSRDCTQRFLITAQRRLRRLRRFNWQQSPPERRIHMLAEKWVIAERKSLRERIESLVSSKQTLYSVADHELFNEFKSSLNRGQIRAAQRTE